MTNLLKFITCGSVDDGKSTLIGHILYDSKLIYADQEQALLLDSQVGSRGGKTDYSLLLDGLTAEREQGITIDVAYRYFTTDNRSFIVADTPGHEEYTRNMAVGASFADLSIILIDALAGVLKQTRRHARICSMMGIKHYIFAVNKMDLANYNEDTYNKIKEDIFALKEELSLENITVIPVSATEGDNVTIKSDKMPWYTDKTLLEYLETVEIESENNEKGFYLPIQRVCRPNYTFRGFQGNIEAGSINTGDIITVVPSNEKAVIKQIYVGDKLSETATSGQPVTIQLDKEVDVSRGSVLTSKANLKVSKSLSASILWMDDSELIAGNEYLIKIGTKLLPATVAGIDYTVDINTGEHQSAESITKNEIAVCKIILAQPTVLDLFNKHKTLGEFILIDRVTHATSACGVVEKINQNDNDGTVFDDGEIQTAVNIFDGVYFDLESGIISKQYNSNIVYSIGDTIELAGKGFTYPNDFDIQTENAVVIIRNGKFEGFGEHNSEVPYVNKYGVGITENGFEPFEKYHKVIFK